MHSWAPITWQGMPLHWDPGHLTDKSWSSGDTTRDLDTVLWHSPLTMSPSLCLLFFAFGILLLVGLLLTVSLIYLLFALVLQILYCHLCFKGHSLPPGNHGLFSFKLRLLIPLSCLMQSFPLLGLRLLSLIALILLKIWLGPHTSLTVSVARKWHIWLPNCSRLWQLLSCASRWSRNSHL